MNICLSQYYNEYKQNYHSPAQLIRVVTENWFRDNMFCPFCYSDRIEVFQNNYPVADFYCDSCGEKYQAKSKKNSFGNTIVDGEYNRMIEAILARRTPNFLFLNYTQSFDSIIDLIIVPKEFILPNAIQKRKPLSPTARRAGWTGCNILLSTIPDQGKIYAVKDKRPIEKDEVRNNVIKVDFFRKVKDLNTRGWISDILSLISYIKSDVFRLEDIYKYADFLKNLHPQNNNIQAKIRQQLQILRDHKIIDFIGRGVYKKL